MEVLCAQVRNCARDLNTSQIDGLIHSIHQGDTWCGDHLMSIPQEVDKRWDLASIWTGLLQLYEERTGNSWTSWLTRRSIPPDARNWPADSYMASWYAQDRRTMEAWFAQRSVGRAVSSPKRNPGSHARSIAGITVEQEAIVRAPLLEWFGRLCNARVREEVLELAQADIRRRARRLLDEGCSPETVRRFVRWQALLCISAVLCDTYHRVRGGSGK